MANQIKRVDPGTLKPSKVQSPEEELRLLEQQLIQNLPYVQEKDKEEYLARLDTVKSLRETAASNRDIIPIQMAPHKPSTSQIPTLFPGDHFASYDGFEPSLISHLRENRKSLLENFAKE